MANAQPDPSSQLTYLEHFGLDQSPFARLPGPTAIYAADQYSVLMAHLANAQAETDRLVVLRGVDGSGKTTLLNRFLSGLEEEASFASIDEQCKSAEAFHLSLLQQIGFSNLEGRLGELQNITREFLVHRATAGDHLLLVIDNAHQIHPAVFEQLCWLAAIQHEERRVLSVILAGNSELDHVLESPAMAKLEFRSRTDFHIRAYAEDETADYIRHRLALAGAADQVSFTSEALALVYRFTGGIPRRINRVCNLLLNEANTRGTHTIDDAIVRSVAEAEQLPANLYPLKSRGRRKTDVISEPPPADSLIEKHDQSGDAEDLDVQRERIAVSQQPDIDVVRLFDQIAELSEQIGKLKAGKADSDRMIESQNLDIKNLRQSLARKDESLERSAEDAKTLAESLKEEKKAAKAAKSAATRAENRITRLEAAKDKLQKASTELRADLREAKKKVKKLTKVEQQLDKTAKEKESLLTEMQDLENLQQTIIDRDGTIAALKDELADLSESFTQTQARLAEMPKPDSASGVGKDSGSGRANSGIAAFEIIREGVVEQVLKIDAEHSRIMIGRDAGSDLQLNSRFVSRHHALIFCGPDGTYIEDLHSFNGTIVNGEIVSRSDLQPHDTIIIGEFHIRPV